MGNNFSQPPGSDGVPTLDSLGGYYRPAVKRKDELDTKIAWLGKAVLDQADNMEKALDLGNPTTKEMAFAAVGGPKERKHTGFGSSAPQYGGGMRPGTSVGGVRQVRNSQPFSAGAGRPSTVQGARGSSAVRNGALRPTIRSSELATADAVAQAQHLKKLDAARASYDMGYGVSRPGTVPVGALRPSTAASVNSVSNRMGRPAPPPRGRKAAATAAAQARRAAEAEAAAQAQHWRVRVWAAKRRLYLYLRGYMAWMSVLKKKRRGYADALTVELLPMFMTNTLGDLALQFGEHLKNCGGLIEVGPEARAKLTALAGGRAWMARLKMKQLLTQPDPEPEAEPEQHTERHSPHSPSRVLGEEGTVQPGMIITSPTGGGGSPTRRRGGARSAAPSGAGANGTRLGGNIDGGLLMVKAAVIDSTKTMLHKAKGRDARSRYSKEIDVVRKLTSLYMTRGPVTTTVIGQREKGDLDGMMKAEQVNLQMMANKACARWVESYQESAKAVAAAAERAAAPASVSEERGEADSSAAAGSSGSAAAAAKSSKPGWAAPTVLDSKMLKAGGVDVEMYRQVAGGLAAEGQVALMMVYMGEEQVVGAADARGAEAKEPAACTDLWAAISRLFPHKVPAGQRVTGLTSLDRRVLQAVVDIEKAGGAGAVGALTIILAVDSLHTAWVAEQAALRHHWTLLPEQIIIVSIARFPGLMWEDVTKTFLVNFSHQFPYLSAGSGYAMLALGWPSHAFNVTPEGEREYIAGSTLKLLEKRGIQYIYTTYLCDWDALTPAAPALDPAFCGPAIYGIDVKGAGMAMQVTVSKTDAAARAGNLLVMAPRAGEVFSCAISMTDLQTTPTRALILQQQKTGQVVAATSRYFFQLKYLASILTGPNAFHVKVEALAPCAYVTLDIADLSSGHAGRAVAVLGKSPGPNPRASLLSKEWLRDFGSQLVAQDAQPAFRQRVAAITAPPAPGHPKSGVGAAGAVGVQEDEGGAGALKGAHILLFVKDNTASRLAFRLVRGLLRQAGDKLSLVHVIHASAPLDEGKALLASFTDPMLEHALRRKLVQQVDKLTDTMLGEVETLKPDLVVCATEVLAAAQDVRTGAAPAQLGSGAQTTSVALALARLVTDTPLLVIKPNSAGDLFQTPEHPGMTTPIKAMLEVQTAAMSMMQWLGRRMAPEKDKLWLVRPYGLEKATHKETTQAARILAAFHNEAMGSLRFNNYTAKKLSIAEGPGDGFASLVVSEKVDLLGLVAPSAKVTPSHILELVRTGRTNILIWRQPGGGREDAFGY